ncbi:MAG: LuxR C-terminal-related transcriptional regulator [Actinomycetota bacterium]|nr:LuxR C-terminal-related transcriptional regulator [Actinomycetota bacterium]
MIAGPAPGRAALANHDWALAYEELKGVESGLLDGEGLDRLAEAAWWLSRIDECIEAREAAYRAHDAAGDEVAAGTAATWLFEHHCFKGQAAVAGAWLRRARRALDGHRETAGYGQLLLREAELAHGAGQLAVARVLSDDALELARRLRDPELEALALQTGGRVAIDAGDSAAGFGRLDDAMLIATEGRVGPYATGKVYCSLITACESVGDLRRAAEWTELTSQWSQRHPMAIFPGLCRIHRAQLLGSRGQWHEAVGEARLACQELAGANLGNAAVGWAEIGDILRRLGDLSGAEEAFAEAERLSGRPFGAVSLLRLAEGRITEARQLIDGAMAGESWNRLARARLLPARVQIAIASGDLETAAADVAELDAIAEQYDTDLLRASSGTSHGRLDLALGHCAAACERLRAALAVWILLGVPYEVATTRLLLGHACWKMGDEAGAAAALDAAAATFASLGATVAVPSPDELRAGDRTVLPHGLTVREAEVLALVAAGLSNKEISVDLHVSPKTVARHLENIFLKIGVGNRAAATAFAYENGLLARA